MRAARGVGVQEKAARKELEFGKVWGKVNPGDLMTKHLPAAEIEDHLRRMSTTYREGRAATAPKLVKAIQAVLWRYSNARERKRVVG